MVANADFIGGYALWVDDDGLRNHTHSFLGVETYKQVSMEPIPVDLAYEDRAPARSPGP